MRLEKADSGLVYKHSYSQFMLQAFVLPSLQLQHQQRLWAHNRCDNDKRRDLACTGTGYPYIKETTREARGVVEGVTERFRHFWVSLRLPA